MTLLQSFRKRFQVSDLHVKSGLVTAVQGLTIEANGPSVAVGELCAVVKARSGQRHLSALEMIFGQRNVMNVDRRGNDKSAPEVLAEVVALKEGRVTLMPYGSTDRMTIGSHVVALGNPLEVPVGDELLGRVIDAFGNPLDGLNAPPATKKRSIRPIPTNPMNRPRIVEVLETGVRVIDGLLTIGKGQRVGIFAGSGVGKSTLLGALARNVTSDVNVIALIGERGREVRDFVDAHLGEAGLAKSIVVVATSDQPALVRIRAAHAALTIAEAFRDQGKHVMLTMDSITRFAMARREVGIAAQEPPTARGYTPSVFADLPQMCERCGCSASGGSITAFFTVLVEGDDLNEPISDALRAILDGHIVLSRQMAQNGVYPPVDTLKSASRVMSDLVTDKEQNLITRTISTLALLERNRAMIELGAYERGSQPDLDAALTVEKNLHQWLTQGKQRVTRKDAIESLSNVFSTSGEAGK